MSVGPVHYASGNRHHPKSWGAPPPAWRSYHWLMANPAALDAAARRIHALACRGLDSVHLRLETLREIRTVVPVEGAFFPTADPATLLYTSAVRVDMPDGVTGEFLDNEFHTPDVNKFRSLAGASSNVSTIDTATRGDRNTSRRSREIMAPLGLGDELRAAFRTGSTTWGFACLRRASTSPSFSAEEAAFIAAVSPHVAEGLRRAIMTERAIEAASPDGPGIITLAPDGTVLAATANGDRWLADLADADQPRSASLPLAVQAVAQAVTDITASPQVPRLTVRSASGRWLVLHASHLAFEGHVQVAVVIEPASPAELEPMIALGYSLTPREAETLTLLLRGLPSKAIAARLTVTTHTANDHIKAIFAKIGVRTRGELMATVFRDRHSPTP